MGLLPSTSVFATADTNSANCFYTSVLDFGAKGDGIADDTDSIQKAINHVYERGGGTVYFPFAPKGYRIARPAQAVVDGKACKSQLYIPAESVDFLKWRNICLQGEMPCKQLYAYQMVSPGIRWPATEFPMQINNCVLFSDWEAPENTNAPAARPWALISVLGGWTSDRPLELPFGVENLTIKNLEFRVVLNPDRMYPTSSAANFKNTSRLIIEDSYFGLTKNVASYSQQKELLANPSYCAGLIASADQNDHQAFRSVGVQGFKYGFVLGEHVMADYLYVHNCEQGIVFHDSSHLSHIHHVVAQHNKIVISVLNQTTFELNPSRDVYFIIDSVDFERGTVKPDAYLMKYGVYDPDNRMHAKITFHSGYPCAGAPFPVFGGKYVKVEKFGYDGPAFVLNWQVAGPFAERSAETAVLPEQGQEWRAPHSIDAYLIMPQDVKKSPKPGMFYLRTAIKVPSASKFNLSLGADSPHKIWVNGREVGSNMTATNPCGEDKFTYPVDLQAGRNEIMVAFDGREGKGYGIRMRFFSWINGETMAPESILVEK